MTVAQATALVRRYARNAENTSMYTDADVHHAIMFVGEDLSWRTNLINEWADIFISANAATVDFSTELDDFDRRRLYEVWIDANDAADGKDHIVECGTISDVISRRSEFGNDVGYISLLGFGSDSEALLWHIPEDDTTLNLLWRPPFTQWDAGDGNAANTELNLPDHIFRQALLLAAPAILQHNEQEHLYSTESWKKYLDYAQSVAKSPIGTKFIQRTSRDE
jgi:hypothetical protein